MNKKTFLILFFLIGGLTLQQCKKDCECCFAPVPGFFDIQDLEISHLNLQRGGLENNTLAFEDYGFLNLNFLVEYIAHHQEKKLNFSFINSAYGCTPPQPGSEGSKEEAIELLDIITINNYDENHLAGQSINDILELQDYHINPILLTDFLNEHDGNVPHEWLTLKLLAEPTMNKTFQVKVILNLSTGENFETLSPTVNFE